MTVIFEPLYLADQEITETAFSALRLPDNAHAAWREVRILVDFYRQGKHRRSGKTGIFSPKFQLKTRISGAEFIEFSNANDDVDVCIINPFPSMPYYSFNVWMQGEIAHPGITDAAQKLLDACEIEWDLSKIDRHEPDILCYSNFWAGTERFWDEYVGGVLDRIARYLEKNSDSETAKLAMIGTRHTDPAPFLPFIVERLFTTFLSLRRDLRVSAHPIRYQALDYCQTQFETELVAYMKPYVEAADEKKFFPDTLITQMDLLCRLYQLYGFAYYAVNPHPHSGKVVFSE